MGKTRVQQMRIEQLFMLMLAVLLFYPPFFRGLFFEHELLYSNMYTAVVFAVFYLGVYCQQGRFANDRFPGNIIDWGLVFLLAAYTIATLFTAVNTRYSISEMMKLINYFLVYFMVSRSIKGREDLHRYLTVLYIAGVITAIIGLGAAFGSINFKGAVFAGERIASTLQYPNTLAVYLTAVLIIGYYLQVIVQSQAYRYVFAGGNYLLLLTFLGTGSRGGFLVMVPVVLLFFVIVPKGYKILSALAIGGSIIASLAVISKVLSVAPQTGVWEHWLLLGVGLFVAVLFQAIIEAAHRYKEKLNEHRKLLIIVSIISSVTIIFAAIYFMDGTVIKAFDRISSINLQDRSVIERGYFYKDALKIIADHPILGIGGGGWAAVYKTYRSYNYSTLFTHNYYLQTWIEAGIPGIASLLTIWAGAIFVLWQARKNSSKENSLLIGVLFLSASAIAVHSLIDFNMTFTSIGLLFWALLAGLSGMQAQIAGQIHVNNNSYLYKRHVAVKALVMLGIITFFVLSGGFRLAINHGIAADQAMKKSNIPLAQKELMAANKYDPLNTYYISEIAKKLYLQGVATRDPAALEKAYTYINKAIKLGKTNLNNYQVRANIYLAREEFDQGLQDLEKVRQLDPWRQGHYDDLSETYKNVGMIYLEKGQKAEARKYLTEAAKISKRITAQQALLTPEMRKLWQTGGYAPLQESATIKKNYLEAIVLLAQL